MMDAFAAGAYGALAISAVIGSVIRGAANAVSGSSDPFSLYVLLVIAALFGGLSTLNLFRAARTLLRELDS